MCHENAQLDDEVIGGRDAVGQFRTCLEVPLELGDDTRLEVGGGRRGGVETVVGLARLFGMHRRHGWSAGKPEQDVVFDRDVGLRRRRALCRRQRGLTRRGLLRARPVCGLDAALPRRLGRGLQPPAVAAGPAFWLSAERSGSGNGFFSGSASGFFSGSALAISEGATISTAIGSAAERCGCTSVEINIIASTDRCTTTDAVTPERMARSCSTLPDRCHHAAPASA